MISCTDFIPAYSELFSYLEDTYGREAVSRLWDHLFEPTGEGIPLINFVKKEGIRGCYTYWSGSLNEEAAEFTMYLNEPAGWFLLEMHHCPSKGRLLQLRDEIGITPYHDYCLHCDSYRFAVEQVGLAYIYNFAGVDRAACSILIYDPKAFRGKVIVDENTEIMDRKAAQNEYFHKDFHVSMNRGIHYLGEHYGLRAVKEYLTRYTKNVCRAAIEATKAQGLVALQGQISGTYEKEKALDVLTMECTPSQLTVRISACPAVTHLKATGREVSPWFRYTTEVVMAVLAESAGLSFTMDAYDEETGAAQYHFSVN